MSRTFDLIVQAAVAPRASLAADRHLLEEVRASRAGVLRIYQLEGSVLALGRYHMAPDRLSGSGVQLMRRHSGGRAVPAGTGFTGISLVLPHRSALVGDDPLALAPAQVLNRCVRGILEACKLAGVAAFYPGRDTITVNGRIVAFVSFEVDAHGGCLFEAYLAVNRDPSCLPHLLDRVDPGGAVPAVMLTEAETTSLARELGRDVTGQELVDLLSRGYASRLDVELRPRTFTEAERRALEVTGWREFADDAWLAARRRGDLDRHASTRGQLGVIEAHLKRVGDRIGTITLAGDFIANSPAIATLQTALGGVAPHAVDDVVEGIFADPANFVLGIGPPRTLTETIVKALAG
jgi:lipoate-protein ligase A